jgi:hypothetical protein
MYEYGIAFKPGVGPQIYIHPAYLLYVLSLGHICMNQMLLMCVLRLYSYNTIDYMYVLNFLWFYKVYIYANIINPMSIYC